MISAKKALAIATKANEAQLKPVKTIKELEKHIKSYSEQGFTNTAITESSKSVEDFTATLKANGYRVWDCTPVDRIGSTYLEIEWF